MHGNRYTQELNNELNNGIRWIKQSVTLLSCKRSLTFSKWHVLSLKFHKEKKTGKFIYKHHRGFDKLQLLYISLRSSF